MTCKKCNGRGWYENPKYPNPASWSWAGDPSIKCIISDGTGISLFNIYLKGVEQAYSSTHWKRITLPTKPLPTKAEILEKLGLSEEELKSILK